MADDNHRNRPKQPKITQLSDAGFGSPEQSKAFWNAGRATARGKIFWLDIETTGLGQQVTEFGPQRWNEIVKKLDKETNLAKKLEVFRQFDEHKYFEQIGLAQFVTHNRQGPKVGQAGIPPWQHGAGYTIWEDNLANTLLSKRYEVSEFSRRKGIVKRSLESALTGDAKTEFNTLSEFSKQLINNTKWGRTSTIRGWNVWFDVFATQSFMARHAGALDAAGYDPFAMMSAIKRGNLRVESMEEHYFDMLTWKGWRNPDWARKHLRFGRMYAAKVGANPGDPIPIHDHIARKAQGQGSLLRGRFGWKAELLEGIFNQYGTVESSMKGWKFPGGRTLGQLDAHDAMRDIASEYELSRRFVFAKKSMEHYDARWNVLKASFPGRSQEDIVGALSFARAGFLGKEFTAKGMRGSSFIRHMAQPAMTQELLKRAGTIWGAIEAQTQPVYKPSGPHKKIRSPYGDYLRLLWSRDIQSEVSEGIRQQIRADVGQKLTRAQNAWSSMGRKGKAGVLGAAAFILYNAFGRQQETIDSNIPYNYQPGQQSTNKSIDVPWSSPWEGIATDDRSAIDMIAKAGITAGAGWAFYNSPSLIHKFFGQEGMHKMFLQARMLEDMVPFRVGRFLNVSSYWSSFMTPDQYNLAFKHLAHGDMALTAVGRRYAETLGVSHHDLLRSINTQKTRGQTHLRHVKVSANSPFMRIDLDDLGEFDVRMFESTSRLGNSFGGMGTDSIQMRGITPQQQAKRVRHILNDVIEPGEFGLPRRFIRGLHKLFPGFVGDAVSRWAAVPQWDRNEFMDLQKTRQMSGQAVFVPGYKKGDRLRAARGIARDYGISGYSALRQQAAVFGMKMPAATSVGAMAKGIAGVGIKTTAAITAFGLVNNTLGGALTDPFFNVYERLMLARASFSDFTGLTGLREQLPDVQGTAVLGVLGVPLGASLLYKYGVRQRSLLQDYRGLKNSLTPYEDSIWGVDERGLGVNIREESYKTAQARGTSGIKRALYRSDMYDDFDNMLGPRHYMQWSNLTRFGKGLAATMAGLTAATLPFLLGSKHSRDELEEIYAGTRNVEIKRGRWWELGSTPYEGGRTHYYRRHQIARRKLRAEEEIPGAGMTGLGGAIRSLFNPYWREQEAYVDRPYPITGGTVLGEIPLVGGLLDATIGRWIKPPRLMHTDEWQSGQAYEQYGRSLAPGPGGLPSPTPRDPSGLAAQVRELTYRGTELAGLRGYLTQAIGFQKIFGGDMPFEQAAMLEPARLRPGITDAFWERDLGGMLGANEIFRRLYPRPERGTEVNPLRNQMPSWLPGDEYFVNFKTGDPYSKVRYGAERLPGPGYAALNPEVRGMHPEDYSAFHKYRILADVAPWAQQTRSMRGAAYAEARNQPARLEELDRIDRQVDQVRRKRDFQDYSFLAGRDKITGTVSRVGINGEITLANYPHHIFTLSGLNMGSSAVADQLRRNSNLTKEQATQRAFEARYERQAVLQNLLLGSRVSVDIRKGGMNAPDVAGTFSLGGTNINRLLVDRGLAGNEGGRSTAGPLTSLYGGAMESIGHLPQLIPGPWMTMTKFFNQADPMEDYRRQVLYGSNNRFWDSPYENFIRPYLHQTISKLTPGEYIPAHIEEQRELDVYLDRMKFLKYAEGGEPGRARRTMAGGNMYGSSDMIQSSLPHREKLFFEAFRQETDPRARKRILSMVSQDMQRALVGQWSQQYAATEGRKINAKPDIQQAVHMARNQLHRMGRPVPPVNWAGNDPAIDWKDIKTVLVQHEGADTHDYNIWDDRTNTLLRKPFIHGAVEGLTSRRMPTEINSMSKDIGRNLGTTILPIETFNHSQTVSFTMNNNVNYSAWERDRYRVERDRLIGV